MRQAPLGQRCRAGPRSLGAVGTFADLGTLESLQSLGSFSGASFFHFFCELQEVLDEG